MVRLCQFGCQRSHLVIKSRLWCRCFMLKFKPHHNEMSFCNVSEPASCHVLWALLIRGLGEHSNPKLNIQTNNTLRLIFSVASSPVLLLLIYSTICICTDLQTDSIAVTDTRNRQKGLPLLHPKFCFWHCVPVRGCIFVSEIESLPPPKLVFRTWLSDDHTKVHPLNFKMLLEPAP